MIPVYVVHYDKLTERKKYIDSLRIGPVYVSDYSKENLTDQDFATYYNKSPKVWAEKIEGLSPSDFRELTGADLSCCLNHRASWERFIKNTEKPFGLFLEDDIIYSGINLQNDIMNIYYHMPDDCDVLFLGGSFPHERMQTLRVENALYHLKNPPNTNCSFVYLVSRRVANLLLGNIVQFTLPIDFEFNYWFKKLNLNVYHYIPYILKEGSSSGQYKSSVR